MKLSVFLFLATITNHNLYSQNVSDILFQYSGQSITIRKLGENNPMFYSPKHDRLLTYKEELTVYPDTTYYLIKPTLIIFSAKTFESDERPEINIRVDYYYQKTNGQMMKIDNWQKNYYPARQKVVKFKDTRETDGRVLFTMDDKSEWLIEKNKEGNVSLFYLTHKEFSYLNFALMFPDCRTEIVNGSRL